MLPSLAAGESASASVTVQVADDGTRGAAEVLQVTATVDGVPADPDLSDNSITLTTTLHPPTPAEVDRFGGAERIETAVLVSQATFADGEAGAVLLSRSDAFADAVAGTPLGAALGGPILLATGDALPEQTAAEIDRVLADGGEVILLGGTAALGTAVEEAVAALGHPVRRIAGPNRFATAVAVAEELGAPDTVLLAEGGDWPAAVSAGPAAHAVGGAVLLTSDADLPPETAAYLQAHPDAEVTAIGADAATAAPEATAVGDADPVSTAVAIAEAFFDAPTAAGLATAAQFPDALAGGVQTALAGGPLLLTDPDALPAAVAEYLEANAASLGLVNLYGGTAAITEQVAQDVVDAIE